MKRSPLILALLLGGCTLESFDVKPCSLNGQLAFRIHEIDGLFSDYQPRPMAVVVHEADGPHRFPGIWSAEYKYYGDRDNGFDRRPARKLIVYGQKLAGWDVSQPALPLQQGVKYDIFVGDGGHSGYSEFTYGARLVACS